MNRERRITSPLGHVLSLRMDSGDPSRMVIKREDGIKPDIVTLDRTGAEILSAFIATARLVGSEGTPVENIGDADDTKLELVRKPAPAIRVRQHSGSSIEIGAPFWDRLYCELALFIPRLVGPIMLGPRAGEACH